MEKDLKRLGLIKKDRANLIKTLEIAHKDLGHAIKVAQIVAKYDQSDQMIKAALYHDVLESKLISKNDIVDLLDEETVFLIESISNIKNIDLKNLPKNEKDVFYTIKVQSIRKLLLTAGKDVRTILLKLAEQIVNLEDDHLKSWKRKQIAKASLLVLSPLAERMGLGLIKDRLDDNAFRILEPRNYRKTVNQINQSVSKMNQSPKELETEISKKLTDLKIKFIIKSRIKKPFSVYNKLKQNDLSIDNLHDLVGLRIIVNSKTDCYRILSEINSQYIISTIKDYIAKPKANGYMSIHAIISDQNDNQFEIQIRTKKMNEKAENGPWAQWCYKEHGSTINPKLKKETEWFKKLAREIEDSQTKTLEDLRINIFENRIFVYSPKEEVIELPKGSTPIDYAYRIHSDLGNYLKGAKVNGKLVKLSQVLSNGDHVEVVIDKKKTKPTPTKDWLNYVITQKAKDHIKRYS